MSIHNRLRAEAIAIAAIAFLPLAVAPAKAADYPQRPIKIVIAFGPGGATDLTARELARQLQSKLGQPVVIENKPSAGSIVAMQAVATAAPDGYTLIIGTPAGFSVTPYLFKTVPYNARDFVPIAPISAMPNVVVAKPDYPVSSLSELVKRAKGKSASASVTYGSFGTGTTSHLAMEMFRSATGVEAMHVPYKGDAPALIAIKSKEVEVAVITMFTAQSRIATGELKGLGVLQARPSRVMPSLQTAAQAGAAEVDLPSWLALFAPPKTPKAITDKLEVAVRSVLNTPEFQDFLLKHGSEPLTGSNKEFLAMIDKQSALLSAKIRELKLVGEE